MKIIKEGKIPTLPTYAKRLECLNCGCIFEANGDEYIYFSYVDYDRKVKAVCPFCEHEGVVNELSSAEDNQMDIFKMTKEGFEKIPYRKDDTDLSDFYSAVIIPTGEMHDSGFMCMDFVAINSNREPICRLSGCSDVLDLDGIGGYGENRELTSDIEVKGWKIDCIPCGYLRIFAKDGYKLKVDYMAGSNYSLYAVPDRTTEGG